MRRATQIILIFSTIGCSWMGMMVVHELGHVLHAWISGGTVTKVVLHPLQISRTDVRPNPHPLFVVWGGPLWGILIPAAVWAVAAWFKWAWHFVLRFFAGFCLIANGAYLAVGSLGRVGDAGDLMNQGTPLWLLILFGAVTIVPGFWLWHGLGPHFGLGDPRGRVDTKTAWWMMVVFTVLVVVEILLSP